MKTKNKTRCFKLIRADWTDLESGTIKFKVGQIACGVKPPQGLEPWKPNPVPTHINFAMGLEEWCPLIGNHPDTILIEIEPIGEIKKSKMVGRAFSYSECVRVIRQITELSQLL